MVNNARVIAAKSGNREHSYFGPCNQAPSASVLHVSVRRGPCGKSIRSSTCPAHLEYCGSSSIPTKQILCRLQVSHHVYLPAEQVDLQHGACPRMPVNATGMYTLAHPIGDIVSHWHQDSESSLQERVKAAHPDKNSVSV